MLMQNPTYKYVGVDNFWVSARQPRSEALTKNQVH